jgi:hypothetical protein
MVVFDLIFGFLLLFAGRNFFWLCVGIVGFLSGVQFAALLGLPYEGAAALAAALVFGVIGVVLAVSFEWAAVVIGAGFLGGGYLLMNIMAPAGQQDPYSWLIFLAGGIIGLCLMVIAFDWTLIIISSLVGATLIAHAYHGQGNFRDILFIGCMGMGLIVQYLALKGMSKREGREKNL